MVAGQPEDISVVLSNFNAIATTINGNLDDANVKATAGIALTKLASAGQIGASGVVIGASSITFGGDTSFYRFAANFLGTTSDFVARQGSAGQISLQSITNVPYILFGSSQDTSLFRSAANELTTGGIFKSLGDLYSQMGLSTQLRMGNSSGNPTIEFGNALDTRIYRNAASSLKTDGQLVVANQILVGSITDPNGAPHLGLANSGGVLATPTGGGVLFVDAGVLKYRGSAGSLTTVAPA